MKDNWIKQFQDRLGEYELDLPQAEARPRKRIILPLLTAAAAAAVLLLVFLPSSSRRFAPGDVLRDGRLIAEIPATLSTEMPECPSQAIMPLRQMKKRSSQPGQNMDETPATDDSAVTGFTEPAETMESAAVHEPAVQAECKDSITAEAKEEPAGIAWAEGPDELGASHGTGFSARMHFSPLAFQANGSLYSGNPNEALSPIGLALSDNVKEYSNTSRNPDDVYYPKTINSYSNTEGIESVSCDLPLKFGLTIRWQATGRFALESGLGYDYQHSKIIYREAFYPAGMQELCMHYIGIPLKGLFSISQWEKFNIYAAVGTEAEFMVSGSIISKASGMVVARERMMERPMLFSAGASVGADYSFNSRVGLYAEPGISWHMVQETRVPLYYKEHPVSFDLHVGLRFNL